MIEWRDGNYSKHGVGRCTGETRPRWAAIRGGGAATGVAGGVSCERVDAAGLRATGGHPLHDVLRVGVIGGARGQASGARGEGSGAFCRGGTAGERRTGSGGATAGRHDPARRAGRGTGRAGAGIAGLTHHAGLPPFDPDLRGGGDGGHETIVQWAVDGGERTLAGGSEERRGVLLYQQGAHAAEAHVLPVHWKLRTTAVSSLS